MTDKVDRIAALAHDMFMTMDAEDLTNAEAGAVISTLLTAWLVEKVPAKKHKAFAEKVAEASLTYFSNRH